MTQQAEAMSINPDHRAEYLRLGVLVRTGGPAIREREMEEASVVGWVGEARMKQERTKASANPILQYRNAK